MQVLKKLYMIDSRIKQKNLLLLIGVFLWLIILVSLIFIFSEYKALISYDIIEIFPSIVSLSAIVGLISLLYLNKNDRTRSSKVDNLFIYSELLKEKGENDKKKEQQENAEKQQENKEECQFTTPVDKNVDDENTANEIKHTFLASEERIKEEIHNLKNRATLNLVLGVTISCAAFLVFFFLVYNEKPEYDYRKVFMHFIPRVGLVVFIELLAYFFLRLYKTSLSSIQYYHNELTNIETRKIAAIVAIKHCGEDKIWEAVEQLLRVERNVLIKDKETTIQMEMLKLQSEKDNSDLLSMQGLLNKVIDKLGNN